MTSHFTPTPAELALVNQIFAQADTQKVGIITGEVAVRIFGGARLSPTVLGEIWNIADEDNNGFLARKGVALAVRLMGWAQKGEKISPALLSKPGPLVTIDGVQPPLVPQGTGMSMPKSPPNLPLLTPHDKTKFARIFQNCWPVNGLLSGEKAHDVFVKSKLPVDKLSQIWSLSDTQDRGALDLVDFTIAMYLIQATMSGQLSFIPTSLPPGLYEQAGGAAVVAHATGSSGHPSSPLTSALPSALKQPPAQVNYRVQPNLGLPPRPALAVQTPTVPSFPGVVPPAAAHWDVTSAEKARADRLFDTLDSSKRGYIEGDIAVPFMLQSKLPEDVLAQVWDLADINKDGRLTRDGFAVAMHLIQGKLSGKDVPASLPSTLVPPSMRSNGTASPFTAAPPQPAEPIRDLLWDDTPPASSVNAQPQHNVFQPQTTGITPPALSPPASLRQSTIVQDPFASAPRNSFHKDLLGDDDETHPPSALHDKSAEIGNLQNHVNSTNRSLQNAKAEREALEATLANQAAQFSALQTQLASAKASFETETSILNNLKERHANQNAEIQKVREELIRSESDLSAIRVEKAEIEGSFLRDKEEVRDLNRRMAEVTVQIATTKQEVEKVKKDAKQQKGLLAIARKQLSTKESEKAKADQSLEDAQVDLADTIREREDAEGEAEKSLVASPQPLAVPEKVLSPADTLAFAAAHPLPVTPDITGGGPLSPNSGKSNNPFERLAMSSGPSTPRSQSPFRSFSVASAPLPSSIPPPLDLSPPHEGVATVDDPFGITHTFNSQAQPLSEVTPDTNVGTSTPKVKALLGEFSEVVSSPTDDELFTTPPNSTTPVSHAGEATPYIHSLDTAAAYFPALDDIPSGPIHGKGDETELSIDLHKLDVNELDSDSDSDEEEEHKGPSQDKLSHPLEVSPSKNEPAPPPAPISFDDIFRAPSDAPAETAPSVPEAAPQTDNVSSAQNGSAALDAFGVPLTKPAATPEDSQDSGFTFINTPANVASKDSSGMSSFDEAFGKSSSIAPPQTASNLSFESAFESAFEDNFDFSASSGATTGFPSATAPPANGSTTIKQNVATTPNSAPDALSLPVNGDSTATPKAAPAQTPATFDAAFSSGPWSVPPGASEPEKTASNQSGLATISFEEAFGGIDTSQALKLDDSFSSRASNAAPNSESPPHHEGGKPFPTMSPPTSPRGPASSQVSSSIRSNSPQPRATSPPPRVASPKSQRPSTSSSSAKDAAREKPPQPPRHKLSIRLFGRKKKQESVPPVPSPQSAPHLTRVDEPGTVTPAVEDDVEPVKQLAGMGFSRNQAIAALEAHDYDVPRALNRLLGSQ